MTNRLRMELDSINLNEVIEPMFGILDQAIEHILENSDMEVSTLDIIDYISTNLQKRAEDTRNLSENEDGIGVNYDDVYDTLEGLGTPSEVIDYLNDIDFNSNEYQGWTLADYEADFTHKMTDVEDFNDVESDEISEDELMLEMFAKHAGLRV